MLSIGQTNTDTSIRDRFARVVRRPFASSSAVTFGLFREWNCERERRSVTGIRLDPDLPAMALDDPATEGKPDSRPGMLLVCVKALEYLENDIGVVGINADSLIPNYHFRHCIVSFGSDLYARGFVTAIFDRIVQ